MTTPTTTKQPKDMYSSSILQLKRGRLGFKNETLHKQTGPFQVNESISDKPLHQPCKKRGWTLPQTNIAMENGQFQDVFPIEHVL